MQPVTVIKTPDTVLSFVILILMTKHHLVSSQCNSCDGNFATSEGKAAIDFALDGAIGKAFLVPSYTDDCFTKCIEDDCTCLSFNYKMAPDENGMHMCELNYEDKESKNKSFKPRKGWKYYEIISEGSDGSCSMSGCTNTCCHPNPCRHNGTCSPLCGSIRRFQCHCNSTGYGGRFCQTPLRTCADHLQLDTASVSGIYTVVLKENVTMKVFCEMDTSSNISWTLVHSFYFMHNSVFHSTPFHESLATNEDIPNFSQYRLSLNRMLELKKYSPLWKASCSYDKPPVDKKRDTLVGSFVVTDLLERTTSDICRNVTYVNIRGYECLNKCDVVLRNGNVAVNMGVAATKNMCSFKPTTKGPEKAFGFYREFNENFSCTNEPTASTQWWFGKNV